jgi:nucleotide-binding universal stress UspA family protein
MFRTILVPLDGSKLAERALPYAAHLARLANARLLLVRALPELDDASQMDSHPLGGPAERQRFDQLDPTSELAGLAARLQADGLPVETHVQPGDATEIILEAAHAGHADIIVMSTHGRGGLERWIYGSVADQVMRGAEVPVLMAPAACRHAWAPDRPLRILVPLDGSELAEQALEPAAELAEALRLLRIIQIPTPTMYGDAYIDLPFNREAELADARRYLEGIADRLRTEGRTVEFRAIVGTPAFDVARLAHDAGADMIAMATHGYGGLGRLVLGSVATSTLQRADRPVLLARRIGVEQPREQQAPRAEPEATGAAPRPV